MYNEKVKKEFIDDFTSSVSVGRQCVFLFNALEPYEVKWGADICTQRVEIITPVLEQMVGLRKSSFHTRLRILKAYGNWCIENDIPGARTGLLRVKVSGVDKLATETVRSPGHLQSFLNCVYDDVNLGTVDNIYRCYYWLAYAGVREENIPEIKTSDVSFEDMIITGPGGGAIIYREAIPVFKSCVYSKEFLNKQSDYAIGRPKYNMRVDGDELIRGVRSRPDVGRLRTLISRHNQICIKQGKTELRLSYYRTWLSGLFYRMYEFELAGKEVSFEDITDDYIANRTYKTSEQSLAQSRKRDISYHFMKDYNRWKETLML